MIGNLASFNKLKQDIDTLECLSFMMTDEEKNELMEIKEKFEHNQKNIEEFNNHFSDNAWCTYDSISTELVECANNAYNEKGLDAGEKVLLDFYSSEVKDNISRLKVGPYKERYHLIQNAFDDHFAKRYSASVLEFLSIIDGTVNDFTKSKGFFAEGTDVTAWDCLVGCNESLSKIKDITNASRPRTNKDEIRIPYRNGIMHGRELNYANEYVSCKCVSLLFAVADWIMMKENEEDRKEHYERRKNLESLSEILNKALNKVHQSEIDRENLSKWEKREIVVGEIISETPSIKDCSDYPYIIPILKMFDEWRNKNYGYLSKTLNYMFLHHKESLRVLECRKFFENKNFCCFKLVEVEERDCSLSRILVEASWITNDKLFTEPLEFSCAYFKSNYEPTFPWKNDGEWILIPLNVQGLYDDA